MSHRPSTATSRPTKSELVKEFREREIIEAARRVFTREGFQSASMEKIAEEAGLAKGTIYLYFPNREQLIIETLGAGAHRFYSYCREQSPPTFEPEQRVRALVRAMFQHAEEERDFQRALFIELNEWLFTPARQHLVQGLITAHEEFMSYIASILEEGARCRKFRKADHRQHAGYLFSLLGGLFRERLMGLNSSPVEEISAGVADFFLAAIGTKDRKP
ncbi:MAG: TetR/AcrR family transcriptional regulator [Deltaproteobacteria bacterium]|nr:TetR/AcrR family transcriptional regulator [Deltaproteobacteria bacterium]